MPHKTLSFWEFIIAAVLIGAAWPIGAALSSQQIEPFKYVLGRAILQIVFTMSAGLIYLFYPNPDSIVVLAVAAALNVVGMESTRRLGIAYIRAKRGVKREETQNDR